MLDLSRFRDRDRARCHDWCFAAFVHAYATYLDDRLKERMQARRAGGASPGKWHVDGDPVGMACQVAEAWELVPQGRSASATETTAAEDVIGKAQQLKHLLGRFIQCRPTGKAMTNPVVTAALYRLVKESAAMYCELTEMSGPNKSPFSGVADDLKGRAGCYKQDWNHGFRSGLRILAPTLYIFFASTVPVIAFGEQLSKDTDSALTTVETLASAAICGIVHSIIGGQPLLIVGVAEPTIIMYTYIYNFAKNQPNLGEKMFLPWAACYSKQIYQVCRRTFWNVNHSFFMQEAIKGMVGEFSAPDGSNQSQSTFQFQWLYINGLLGFIFSMGVLYTALASRSIIPAAWQRSLIADYGVPLMVILWTSLSYSLPSRIPSGVPRRLFTPLPWEPKSLQHWTVAKDLFSVPTVHIFLAIVPATMVAGLSFFDHSVASQMNLDLWCGLLGIPPSNGVLPQSPMHTRSLAVLKRQLLCKKMVQTAKEGMMNNATSSEVYVKMQDVFIKMDHGGDTVSAHKELKDLKDAIIPEGNGSRTVPEVFDPEKHVDAYLPVRVNEQRVSNLLQSLLITGCIGVTPLIQKIPTSVLWGYFAYMSIDSLPGNQFWERIQLLFITPQRRYNAFQHNMHLHTLPANLSVDRLWDDMDTSSRNPLPTALLLPHYHQCEDESVRSGDAQPGYASEILEEFTTHRGELKRRNSTFHDGRLLQLNSVKMTRELSRVPSWLTRILEEYAVSESELQLSMGVRSLIASLLTEYSLKQATHFSDRCFVYLYLLRVQLFLGFNLYKSVPSCGDEIRGDVQRDLRQLLRVITAIAAGGQVSFAGSLGSDGQYLVLLDAGAVAVAVPSYVSLEEDGEINDENWINRSEAAP
ncbi:Boron transporter 4 [Zea mays]|uniref:Boron transporter 4 n=1 Tax=Zea mays TaxID=4577 RepID=A0A1D6PKM5_MAIZE|nr:Boron transporter 4 [Zea mays]